MCERLSTHLWPPNSQDLNPADYCVWHLMLERVYKTAMRDTADLKQRAPLAFHRLSSTKPLTSGNYDYKPALKQRDFNRNQPDLFRATHILSKKIAMPSSYA